MNPFQRQAAAFDNELRRSSAALIGIIQGVLSDGNLNDDEIVFLGRWLIQNEAAAVAFPGNVLLAQIREVVADGVVTDDERMHLAEVLRKIVGGTLEDLAKSTHVCELALDDIDAVTFEGRSFCLTGDFFFGPRKACAEATERRGGEVIGGITKKLNYLVVGGLGSPEWKHGSFGTKIEKALAYRNDGVPLLVVHEDAWAASLAGSA